MNRTHLPGILAMAAIVVASNILVQYLFGNFNLSLKHLESLLSLRGKNIGSESNDDDQIAKQNQRRE